MGCSPRPAVIQLQLALEASEAPGIPAGSPPCRGSAPRYIHRRSFNRSRGCEMDGTAAAAETHAFQAEVAELLNLMVHSVYSETDIFLRELISNASEDCDKLRYEEIDSPALLGDTVQVAIML